MLSFVDLAARPEFTVSAVDCHDDHRGWSAEAPRRDVRLVLVRSGGFRRRVRGVIADLDRTVGYLGLPGEEEQFAHPAGGDVCTSISLTASLWRSLAGDDARLGSSSVYVDARLDLAHRRLLAATRARKAPELALSLADTASGAAPSPPDTASGAAPSPPDAAFQAALSLADTASESLVGLASEVIRQVVASPIPPDTGAGDQALVARARDAIASGDPAAAGLIPLAGLLGVSPYRLSRVFTRELGVSLTRYRNRVRVGAALDRLEAGETSLSSLAADLGFADQAHLSRTMREHLGHTPTALRTLLRAAAAPSPRSSPSPSTHRTAGR
ncbi:AraC family transcriptional regulator [Lentzea sp. NPDC051838]|uniref:helix-turn-helix transcriptional regulator n=1 Tax=Lentzea sp. NPDC051838 TaxID=3154849 RepID=UPI0034300273